MKRCSISDHGVDEVTGGVAGFDGGFDRLLAGAGNEAVASVCDYDFGLLGEDAF
ncbi:MAG: hypothetical protein ACYSUD_12205 [Planctomycetota bacterium]